MATMYFENIKTGKRYEVVALDKEKGEIRLKDEYAEFVEPYSKERFQKLGYALVKGD